MQFGMLRRSSSLRRAILAPFLILACVSPAGGQDSGTVRGRVIDAAERPVAGASVEGIGTFRAVRTRADGMFALPVPPGDWRIVVRQIGFRPDTITVRGGIARDTSVVVRLRAAPVLLEGLAVRAPRVAPMGQVVSAASVRQVPPLGEPDVFRAVVLLPGVAQPNDLKGRIHLAGGASDETAVRLDGHPLHDPFHLLGLLGAFNVAALDRADVLIHHVPPQIGDALSGVIDLQSRSAEGAGRNEAVFSLVTSGVTVGRAGVPGGTDLLVSMRATYLDRLATTVAPDLPRLGFRDGVVRVGRNWGGGRWRAELLGFHTDDRYTDPDLADSAGYQPLQWGESLAGLRVERNGAGGRVAARASWNRSHAAVDERGAGGTNWIEARRDWLSAAVQGDVAREHWRVRGGASLDARRHDQQWIARGLIDEVFSASTPAEYAGQQALDVAAMFGEGELRPGGCFGASLGARLSWAGGQLFPAPSATVSCRASDSFLLQGAVERRHQFTAQLEEPIEGSISPPTFLLPGGRTVDVAAVSTEWTPGAGSLTVQAFAKRYPDRPRLRDRSAGTTREELAEFPDFERIRGQSYGVTAGGATRLGARARVQGSYTFQRTREQVGGVSSPTNWDAPHAVSLLGSARIPRGWTASAVYQGHSGRATTPVLGRSFEPDLRGPRSGSLLPRYVYGERNSIRVHPYHRVDLGLRRTWRARAADWTLAVQVLNLLARENPIDYDWGVVFDDVRYTGAQNPGRAGRPGLPILPSLGLEVAW
jgi:hypothetical protein